MRKGSLVADGPSSGPEPFPQYAQGWPLIAVETYGHHRLRVKAPAILVNIQYHWKVVGMVVDAGTALASLIIVAVLCEYVIRRKERRL